MKRLLPLLLALWCALVPAQAKALTILTEEDAPYNFTRDGVLAGLSVEIVHEVMRRLKVSIPIQVMPWARAYHLGQTHPDVLLFTLARTPEREEFFSWLGPITTNKWVFFARRGSGITITSLDDTRKLRSIGVYRQDVRHVFLRDQGFTNLDVAVDTIQTLKQLFAGRVDALLLNDEGMASHLAVVNRTMADVEALYTVKTVDLYAGFSRGTDPATVAQWTRVFGDLEREGFVAARRKAWHSGSPDQK